MATDLEISQRIGRAVAEGLQEDPSVERMYQRLLAMSAGFAAGMGSTPAACEEHFIDFARAVYQHALQPPVVECASCHQMNRLKEGPSGTKTPICGMRKSSLIPSLVGFLYSPPPTPPSN